MKQHSENAISVSVIGGADGPTSIFVAGTGEKRALKARIRDSIYRYKRKRAEKRIVAAPHSLAETVQYAKDKYGLTEAAATDSDYIEQMRCLKENLVLRQKPELLGGTAGAGSYGRNCRAGVFGPAGSTQSKNRPTAR